ncbi:MAG: hypothetical protein A4E19_09195 [Nitrospira sp. SG-bin1]|nr:MAG: hypothetical protein A4E19_09195 [Nitrospira sp. SG-bin1]
MDRTIVHYSDDAVAPGKLGTCFREGAKAVLLSDPRAAWIWNQVVDLQSPSRALGSEILSGKNDFLFRLAHNHISRNHTAGDMLRFIPGGIGHVARKIVMRREENGRFETLPSHFSGDAVPKDLLDTSWNLMTDIMRATFPAQCSLPPYKVSVELLKYPSSFEDIERIGSLLRDSCGEWTRIGMAMDTWKARTVGLFDFKFLRDCTAFASLIPGVHGILSAINGWMVPFSNKCAPDGTSIIGSPHCDGGKILTALLSERETLITQVYTGERWQTLPLASDHLAILPSAQLDGRLGISPTLHRILIKDRLRGEFPTKPNITLCLTASLHG